MIKKVFLALVLIVSSLSGFVSAHEAVDTLLILNMKNESVLPNRFRTCKTPFKAEAGNLTRKGFDDLNISGSSQFSAKSLEKILETIHWDHVFFVVDLRQESHGFINGEAVTWYTNRNWGNRNKSLGQIEKEEEHLIQTVLTQRKIDIFQITALDKNATPLPEAVAIPTVVKDAYTERTLIKKLNLRYCRIPITDHVKPSDSDVERFVSFVKVLPKDVWVHFHCSAGVGRTTTMMAMFDMMKNAKEVSFDDILERQNAIGGKNLKDVKESKPTKAWKAPLAVERLAFLVKFYDYCKNNQDNYNRTWTEYLKSTDM